ncbi:hypothetical protein L3X38_043087 [Prunus dulcis]|uniref:Uncharacterized protein n=1 Tax=Prunus dulcis TaxID=3755 RepID=A0AAD4UVS6_PRUDU|nr:hypothetical protein L3X38_043073 [Prunus dulcis]KAI5313905.1 hypothetical protein L3X38_043081 [Prunus dulcis]KAI5313911.1 hypothetical protein L3X38_043087 [Prunus dulcis]
MASVRNLLEALCDQREEAFIFLHHFTLHIASSFSILFSLNLLISTWNNFLPTPTARLQTTSLPRRPKRKKEKGKKRKRKERRRTNRKKVKHLAQARRNKAMDVLLL